jgi:hypothetical protein
MARTEKEVEERREETTERPWLPVAPMTAMVLEDMVDEKELERCGKKRKKRRERTTAALDVATLGSSLPSPL